MDQLDGRVAFITGGAQGIGLGIARALAKRGVKLALADVNAAALQTAQEELSAQTPTESFVLDVRDRAQYASVAYEVERRLGRVSLLFNNAGVAGAEPMVGQWTYEAWDWVLGVNLNGVINGVQTFAPRMIERGGDAYIVNTASGAGLVVVGAGILYTTSKFAVVGLSEALHNSLARHGVGVSVLCPAYVATNIADNSVALNPAGDASDAATVAARSRSKDALAKGTSIDAVGEMVLAAMKAKQLYIYTDDQIGPFLEQRNRMLLDALSTAPPHAKIVRN